MVVDITKPNYDSGIIALKLLTGAGEDELIRFEMEIDEPFEIMMAAYCTYAGLILGEVVFQYDGDTIDEKDTPRSLKMEEEDVIQVHKLYSHGFF